MRTGAVKIALVVLVAAAGLGLKVLRYASGDAEAQALAAERVSAVMARHGWTRVAEAGAGQPLPFEKLTFVRADCAGPVSVALLPGNAESADFARLHFRGDVAFVQGGVAGKPDGMARQGAALWRLVGWAFGDGRAPVLPPLGLSPAPREGSPCTPPGGEAWAG